MSCSSRRIKYISSRLLTCSCRALWGCSARNWRARSIWSLRETVGRLSERIRSSKNWRSTVVCRSARSCLRVRARASASARRGVSGYSRRKTSIVARGAAGSSRADSERASACTVFQRSSCLEIA